MDYKTIRELAALMREMSLTALEYKDNSGESIKMERALTAQPMTGDAVTQEAEVFESQARELSGAGVFTVASPMVGVFYAAPGTDMPPYVSVGDKVCAGDVLCIIEAMKIMNEITAERDGVIYEICAANKQIVEFGQPLFRIDTGRG